MVCVLIIFSRTTFADCAPFRVYKDANVPVPPKISLPANFENDWEQNFLRKIGKIKTQEEFPTIFNNFIIEHKQVTENDRYRWLTCVLFYVSQDTNGNGFPDWTAIIDNQPAKVLYPGEDDIDGDGITNILDPDPLSKDRFSKLNPNEIPAHLKINDESQEILFREFGVLAINHTDEHSPALLKELVNLLRHGFTEKWVKNLKNLKYVYAFLGHDSEHKIAAYHWNAKALSVGGIHAYKKDLSTEQKTELKAALAHEIGHAALLEKLSVNELAEAGKKFGGWNLSQEVSPVSFYAKIFFAPYSFGRDYKKNNIVSAYALTNIHEWFADSFAAHVVNKLGEVFLIQKRKDWADYGNLTTAYRHWLDTKIFVDK